MVGLRMVMGVVERFEEEAGRRVEDPLKGFAAIERKLACAGSHQTCEIRPVSDPIRARNVKPSRPSVIAGIVDA